jgi:hypothetical protein
VTPALLRLAASIDFRPPTAGETVAAYRAALTEAVAAHLRTDTLDALDAIARAFH